MSTGERFNEYIESVLREIRFKEAHEEIRRELTCHLEEARDLASGLNLTNEEIETQVIRRMGDAHQLGLTLNSVHKPTIDVYIPAVVGLMSAIGASAMLQMDRAGLHLLWLGLGFIVMATLALSKPASVRACSWHIYGVTIGLGLWASLFGVWQDGQPYLVWGPLHIKIVDLSAVMFTLALAAPLSNRTAAKRPLLLAALAPFAAYAGISSFFPAVLFGGAFLSMMIVSKQPKALIVAFSAAGTALLAASLRSTTFVAGDRFAEVLKSEEHTDFVFHSISLQSPIVATLTAIAAITSVVYLLASIGSLKNVYCKTVSTGAVVIMATGILWGLLSNLGSIPMPVTGVYFPFLSYSGSLMIAHMALIGVILGAQRRKNLHFC